MVVLLDIWSNLVRKLKNRKDEKAKELVVSREYEGGYDGCCHWKPKAVANANLEQQ
jgi:hypothetical protein